MWFDDYYLCKNFRHIRVTALASNVLAVGVFETDIFHWYIVPRSRLIPRADIFPPHPHTHTPSLKFLSAKSTAFTSVNDIVGYKTCQPVTSTCSSLTENCENSCNGVHDSISPTLTITVLYISNLTEYWILVIRGSPLEVMVIDRYWREVYGAGRCIVFTFCSVVRYHLPSHIFPFAWNATHVTILYCVCVYIYIYIYRWSVL